LDQEGDVGQVRAKARDNEELAQLETRLPISLVLVDSGRGVLLSSCTPMEGAVWEIVKECAKLAGKDWIFCLISSTAAVVQSRMF
jgi:hypothetical protein